jgi:hypothetical protein
MLTAPRAEGLTGVTGALCWASRRTGGLLSVPQAPGRGRATGCMAMAPRCRRGHQLARHARGQGMRRDARRRRLAWEHRRSGNPWLPLRGGDLGGAPGERAEWRECLATSTGAWIGAPGCGPGNSAVRRT